MAMRGGTARSANTDQAAARTQSPRNGPAEASGTPVPAAARAMAVFEVFAREQRELTKSEVARLLDLPESSTSDLLNTLQQLGYVSRTATTRRFYPTGRLLSITTAVSKNNLLTTFGVEATSLLAQRTGETACCGVLTENQIKIVAVSQGRHRLRYVLNVGDTFTTHATAIGKSLLGGLDDEEMGRLLRLKPLPRRTPHTKVNPRDLEEEVREHQKLGWYRAVDEGTVGVSSFAVSGTVGDQVVGLGIVGPTGRVTAEEKTLREIVAEFRDTVFDCS